MPPKAHLNHHLLNAVKKFTTDVTSVKTIEAKITELALNQGVAYYLMHKKYIQTASLRLHFHIEDLNNDADLYIETHLKDTKELQELVEHASDLYYNTDTSVLTDASFDALAYHLRKRLKKQGLKYDKVGALPIKKLRTPLPYLMPSLTKVKPGEKKCTKFLTDNVELVWSLKLNGISALATFTKYKLTELHTHGNSVIGGNISVLKEHLRIPKTLNKNRGLSGNIVVRGELIMLKEDVKKHECGDGRAFVSGKVNSSFVSPHLGDIEFVAYEIVDLDHMSVKRMQIPKPSEALPTLTQLGFNVVVHGKIDTPTTYDIVKLYKNQRSTADYDIDGLVLTVNKPQLSHLKNTNSNVNHAQPPTLSVAFKMPLVEQQRHTTVTNVEWNITRLGRYFPVVVYKPVYLNNSRQTRATGHNAKHVKNWGISSGTKITVIRSGDVIPQIKAVDEATKGVAILPSSTYGWHWDKQDIILDDIDNNKEVIIKRLYHYFKTIQLKGFGEKTAVLFYEHHLKTPEDVIKAKASDFVKIKGIGKKKSESFVKNIHDTLCTISPDRLMTASTHCKAHIGKKSLKLLFRLVPDILLLTTEELNKQLKNRKLPGFGPAKLRNIPQIVEEFNNYLASYDAVVVNNVKHYYVMLVNKLEAEGRNKLISGKKFVLPSSMENQELLEKIEDYILDHQGLIVKAVNKEVSAVVYDQINSKMGDAEELQLPILTIHEFLIRFKIPIRYQKSETDE